MDNFVPIPNYSRYTINKQGEVYDSVTKKLFTYPTLKDASIAHHIDPPQACDRVKTNGLKIFRDGTMWAKYPLLSKSISPVK